MRAWLVHLLTVSGAVLALLAALEVCRPHPDPRWVFAWLGIAVLVDAVDGPLARAWRVKLHVPQIEGRTLDDIVDYLTYTFVPLLLVCRMGWVPDPALAWVAPALVASLFGFAHTGAKQEGEGFFRGFPSYWNVYAFYAGLWASARGPLGPGLLVLALAVLTVTPARFLYLNRAPAPWRRPLVVGALLWTTILAILLPDYPQAGATLVLLSLVYPVLYVAASLHLDLAARRHGR